MHHSRVVCGLAGIVLPFACFAGQLTIHPTTTLSAQTADNTSAATSFMSQSNGNLGATNVSKVNIHSLLYSGASTKIYAHLVPWFGQPNHMNVGYSSTDSAQVKRQIADMISRGVDGVFIDWYGPNNSIDQAARLVMKEAEANPGFTFSIIVDKGAVQSDPCSTCSGQEILVRQLQYIEQTYFSSPAYLTIGGHTVVGNFDIDLFYNIDWNGVQSALASHSMFIFQNNEGFSHAVSGGSYSWVIPTYSDYGTGYLASFYSTGMSFPGKMTTGAAYKGFDDSLASWGSKRSMGQQCGQTWLQTFSEINRLYDSSRQLPTLQLATWNDYEEGTEIESGIDNCLAVSIGLSGNLLQWGVSRNESTVHHYNIYVSSDGENLMTLASPTATLSSLDMCSYSLSSGSYTLYAQAIGKPGFKNQMSGPVAYNPNCGPGTVSLTASPSTLTIPRLQSANVKVAAVPQTGPFSAPVSFSCSNLPEGMVCSFSPSSVAGGSTSANTILTISTMPVTVSVLHRTSGQFQTLIHAGGLLAFGFVGLLIVRCTDRKIRRTDRIRTTRVIGASTVVLTILMLSSCGGNVAPLQVRPIVGVPAGIYTITINAVSGTTQVSSSETVTIQ